MEDGPARAVQGGAVGLGLGGQDVAEVFAEVVEGAVAHGASCRVGWVMGYPVGRFPYGL